MKKTIGEHNLDIIESIVVAHIEHGSVGVNLHEGIILDIPKRLFSLYDGALTEIDEFVRESIIRNKENIKKHRK